MPVDKSLTITAMPKTSLNVVSMAGSPTAMYNRQQSSAAQRDPLGSSTTVAKPKQREQVFGPDGSITLPADVLAKVQWKHPHTLSDADTTPSDTVPAAEINRKRREASKGANGIEVKLRNVIRDGPVSLAMQCIRDALRGGDTRVNKRNPDDGRAMLHTAAGGGKQNAPIVKLLLNECRADPNVKTYLGNDTPLLYAAQAGARQICFFLLASGANVLTANRLGETALHRAASRNTARILIEWGANMWKRDKLQRTPLMAVTEHGNEDVIAYLSEISQELMIEQAERDHAHKHQSEERAALAAAAKAAEDEKAAFKLPPTVSERIRDDYLAWRRGEQGKAEREKKKKKEKKSEARRNNLSVFHSRLPGQYLGKARSTSAAFS